MFLDSASIDDARTAAALGFVRGATTNPALAAEAGRPAAEIVHDLCAVLPGTVFYQLTADTPEAREVEAREVVARAPDRVGLKIPCTLDNLALATRLAGEGFVVGVTAVFSAAQVALASEAGARYVLPYVNRSTRLQGHGPTLIAEMRAVIDALESPTRIVAASVKTPDEAVATLLSGAHHLTLPLAVLRAMAEHALSRQAIDAFRAAASASEPPVSVRSGA
jgi:transaldolase